MKTFKVQGSGTVESRAERKFLFACLISFESYLQHDCYVEGKGPGESES